MITITVPGEPTAKGRPRFRQWKAKDGRAGVTAYTPQKSENAEAFIKQIASQAMMPQEPVPSGLKLGGVELLYDGPTSGQPRRPPLDGPVAVTMIAHFQIRSSWSKKKQLAARTGAVRPTGKPDLDNVLKTYGDALNGIVWLDDSQIVSVTLSKVYSDTPHVLLQVEPWQAVRPIAIAAASAA